MKNRFAIKVMPRDVILDTQGRAVEQTLKLNNMQVSSCRVGKLIELEIEGDANTARQKAEQIAKTVLHNPLLENFEIQEL